MIITLPYVGDIDTLNTPKNFESIVRKSFEKFTELTDKDYRAEDKLLYLDNLREYYTNREESPEDAVMEMITNSVEYGVHVDQYPPAEDFYSFEFMQECYTTGVRKYRFYNKQYDKNPHDNKKTIKVIAEIIRIIMNWQDGEVNG